MKYEVSLPSWLVLELAKIDSPLTSLHSRMDWVIGLSKLNMEHQTGGPFAAAVFETESGKLVSAGVNRVVPENNSSAHAEIVAISMAQKNVGHFDLGSNDQPSHQLVVNGRPCAMCFGAIPWSGVRSLVIGASGEAIEELTGFDEGPIHPNWKVELETRGIEVHEDVLSKKACDVLADFGASGQVVYNGRSKK